VTGVIIDYYKLESGIYKVRKSCFERQVCRDVIEPTVAVIQL